jgi:hypothetical protein
MTKRLCNAMVGNALLTGQIPCGKKFHTRDKNRTKCRKHCGSGNRPNRSLLELKQHKNKLKNLKKSLKAKV